MPDALVGYTGFVGSNLLAQRQFDDCYNSKNIDTIAGRAYDLLVVSGMPAAMWVANKDPDADWAVLDRLVRCLQQVQARRVVVISTVAVYPNPVGVDEDASIDPTAQTAYGRHRLLLEQFAAAHFSRVLAVRLPGLFGPGLRKNAIYDLLHGNEVHKIHATGVYQFYNLQRVWPDISTALTAELELVNLVTEPVSIREVAREAFDLDFANDPGTPPPRFAVRSRHAALFGGRDNYLYDRRQILNELRTFVRAERSGEGTR